MLPVYNSYLVQFQREFFSAAGRRFDRFIQRILLSLFAKNVTTLWTKASSEKKLLEMFACYCQAFFR